MKHSLAALLLALLFFCGGCVSDTISGPSSEPTQETDSAESATNCPYREPPGWASAFQPKPKASASAGNTTGTRVDAVSTMYVDSDPKNFGPVTRITVTAEDNEGVPYDIKSYYRAKDQTVYLFLPSTADLSAVTVWTLHQSGTETGAYTLDFTAKEYGVFWGDGYCAVKAMQSGLPSLCIEIDEAEGTLSAMNRDGSHTTECFGDMTLVVPAALAEENHWDPVTVSRENDPSTPGTMKMRGRGNWTWNQEKKPYQITCEKPVDLCGMGKAKRWILLANVMDASLLRDQVLYELAADMGMPYSVDIQPVDLFVNGEYLGSYSLCEKVETREERVDLGPEGGYLLELDHYYQNERYTFTTKKGKNFTLHSPETDEAVEEIKTIVNAIEKEIYAEDGIPEGIDKASFLRYWWLQDLSRNNDTFIGSNFFFYRNAEQKLYAGPIWDMDNTFGIWGGGENLMTKGWHSANRGWLKHLWNSEAFRDALEAYYREEGKALFARLPDLVLELREYIRESAEMNYLVNRRIDYVNSGTQSWDEDIDYLLRFIRARLAWYEDQLG